MPSRCLKFSLLLLFQIITPQLFALHYANLFGRDIVRGVQFQLDPKTISKGTVIVFLSSQCPCSRSHEPALKKLSAQFKDFVFLGVNSNQDESEAASKLHFQDVKLPFPVIRDRGTKIADTFGAMKTPHVFILDKEGKVLYNGGVDDSHSAQNSKKQYLQTALVSIAEGKEPPVKQTRSLGCMIRR